MDRITHEMRLAQWSRLFQECNESGLAKLEWCKQNKINYKLFFYWQRRVREETYRRTAASDNTTVAAQSAFVQLPIVKPVAPQQQDNPAVTIKACGYSIEISESVSDELLNRLIGALSYAK